MEMIEDIMGKTKLFATQAWAILSLLTGGHPVGGLIVAAAGVAWFAGVWSIIGGMS